MKKRKGRAKGLEEALFERLDLILRVLALQVASEKSLTERARLLKLAGMDNRTIANVLNTSDATIRAVTTNLRAPSTRRKS
jgi:hypothetical protein